MFYKISLQVLLDPAGNNFSYYRYSLLDQNDLEWPWLHGIAFSDPPDSPLRLRLIDDEDAGEFADYIMNPIPLVTARFRKVLDNCGVANIDYYPVAIDNTEGFDDFPEYFAINIVGKVSAAHPEHSKSSMSFGHMGANLFDKLVLSSKAVKGLDFFILAEHLSTIVVSERVKKATENAGIDTLKFTPIECLD